MSKYHKMLASGLEAKSPSFGIPLQPVTFDGDIGDCFSGHGNLYCTVPDKGLYVYRESSLEEIFSCSKVLSVICSLPSSLILLGRDKRFYRYTPSTNLIEELALEGARNFSYRNLHHLGEYLIMMAADPNDDSRRPTQIIHKYMKEPFSLKWKVEAPNKRGGALLIDEDNSVFYVIGNNAAIYCLEVETGNPVWNKDISAYFESRSKIIHAQPALIGDTIVIIYTGVTVAISAKDGGLVWKREGATASWGLIANNGMLYQLESSITDNTRNIITIDAATGKLVSSYQLTAKDNPDFLNSIRVMNPLHWAISETHIIIGWSDALLTAINPLNGVIDWHEDLGRDQGVSIMPDIMTSNNRIYCCTSSPDINDFVTTSRVFEGISGFGG